MHKTMETVQGVGLAAPQVGIGQAVFVFNLDDRQGHVINPVLETWGDEQHEPKEGCLSVPELYYTPPRAQYARVRGGDYEGQPIEYEGNAVFARMLQPAAHHLYGDLFDDRLDGDQCRHARRTTASPAFVNATERINAQRAAEMSSTFGAGPALRSTRSKGHS